MKLTLNHELVLQTAVCLNESLIFQFVGSVLDLPEVVPIRQNPWLTSSSLLPHSLLMLSSSFSPPSLGDTQLSPASRLTWEKFPKSFITSQDGSFFQGKITHCYPTSVNFFPSVLLLAPVSQNSRESSSLQHFLFMSRSNSDV